jgi:hypothetical protein
MHRSDKPASIVGLGDFRKIFVGCQAAFAGKPAPTGKSVHLGIIGRLPGRHRWQASSHRGMGFIWERLVDCQSAIAGRPTPTGEWGSSGKDWSAVSPPSLAGQLPQGSVYISRRLVGWQAAIAAMRRPDKPAPTMDGVHASLFTTQQAER